MRVLSDGGIELNRSESSITLACAREVRGRILSGDLVSEPDSPSLGAIDELIDTLRSNWPDLEPADLNELNATMQAIDPKT